MFVFTFDRGLFKFRADEPALEVLFQLAPTIGKRNDLFPERDLSRFAGIFLRLNPAAEKLSYLVCHVCNQQITLFVYKLQIVG